MQKNRMQDLIATLKNNDINGKWVMVRSSFNGEDLPNYSAAGVYKSLPTEYEPEYLYTSIIRVAQSKWDQPAIASREKYGIAEDSIKPGIILQNYVEPEYKFTLYTNTDDDKLRIELFSDKAWRYQQSAQPNVFTYDRKTKELKYDSVQMDRVTVDYDENLNPQKLESMKYDLSNKPEVLKNVRKLVDNALVIEKEFGAPQDIEGGLVGDDIYLWQTRNIVG